MRISDLSSDVCSSDLLLLRDLDISGTVLEINPETDPDSALIESDDGDDRQRQQRRAQDQEELGTGRQPGETRRDGEAFAPVSGKIGRAACRERGCQYV